jgi:uncharacterized protein (TIGR02611 family)
MTRLRRFRERLVLGAVVHYLDGDEHILAWTHANVPEARAPGILVVTNHHCLLHVASSEIPDITTRLSELSGFTLNRRDPEIVRVRLSGQEQEVDVELSLTNRVRSRSVGRVLSALARHQVAGPASFDPEKTSPVPPMVRSARHHARRVWVTVLGVLVLMISAVFASPFVPGPGALTAVAGIAILAREYEWARDLHVWAARQADRFLTWMRGLRRRRVSQPATPEVERAPRPATAEVERAPRPATAAGERGPGSATPATGRDARRGQVIEAEVAVPASDLQNGGGEGSALAS